MRDPILIGWDEAAAERSASAVWKLRKNRLSLAIAAGLPFAFRPQAMPWNIKTALEPRRMIVCGPQ